MEGENIGLLWLPFLSERAKKQEKKLDLIKLSTLLLVFSINLLPRKERYDERYSSILSITDLPENIKSSIQTFLKSEYGFGNVRIRC